jgi:hypothetical protein
MPGVDSNRRYILKRRLRFLKEKAEAYKISGKETNMFEQEIDALEWGLDRESKLQRLLDSGEIQDFQIR